MERVLPTVVTIVEANLELCRCGAVTGPDIEPMKFKTRREAKDGCTTKYPGSPVKEIVPGRKRKDASDER
jgi:hypothetical protein